MRLNPHRERLHRQRVIHRLLVLVNEDLGIRKSLMHERGAAYMIEMAVRRDYTDEL
jgi:hypothetical protein